MDMLEYLAARVDQFEQYADHHVFSQRQWDRYVRLTNYHVNKVSEVGGEVYADTNVHDTGECNCTYADEM